MNTFHPISKEKIRLSKIARKIREIKDDLHLKGIWPEVNGKTAAELQKQLALMKYVFRHRHIAYCLNRGKSIPDIESAKRPNKRSWNLINIFRIELYEQSLEFYRNMVEDLLEDSKKKNRDVIKFQMVKHVWDLYINDDETDFVDSTAALMDTMNFIIHGPAIVEFKEIGGPIKHIEISFDAEPFGQIVDEDILDNLIKEAEQDDDMIELTDEVIFVGTPDGQIEITEPMKCACCGGTAWHCTCPEFCFPECAVCHNGNGNCTCWYDMYVMDIHPDHNVIDEGDCPFEGEYCNTDYPCSIRIICDFSGKDFHDCETYKTRDPNSHNLQC
jgi:hypothetical protein